MRQDEGAGGRLAVTGIVLMQLGGNDGASRRRFPLVAFEGGLSDPAYSESVLRLARPALPTGSARRPAAAGPGVDSEGNPTRNVVFAEAVSHAQPFLSQDSRYMNVRGGQLPCSESGCSANAPSAGPAAMVLLGELWDWSTNC